MYWTVTMWSVNTRPNPGSRRISARLSGGVGVGCFSWTNERDVTWSIGPLARFPRADPTGRARGCNGAGGAGPEKARRGAASGAHIALELPRRPGDRLLDGFAAHGALRDHLGHGRLGVDLVGDGGRRRRAGGRGQLVAARRVVIERALGRALLEPD